MAAPDSAWVRVPATHHRPSGPRARSKRLMQVHPARGRDAVTGAEEAGMPVDQRRRDEPFLDQALRAIEIGRQRVQQARPLAQARAIGSHSARARRSANASSVHGRAGPPASA
jgi:hypothetical protein